MRPLKLVAFGFLVVFLDINLGGFDVLPLMIWLLYVLFTRAYRSYLDVTGEALTAGAARPAH